MPSLLENQRNLRSVCSMLDFCFPVSRPNSLESSRNASSTSSPLNLKGKAFTAEL